MRRALGHFPVPAVAEWIIERYYRPEGRTPGQAYLPVPNLTLNPVSKSRDLMVASAFVEVWLAKEGHDGLVGINILEKIQLANIVAIDPAEDTLHRFFGVKAFEHRVTTADQMSIAELFRQDARTIIDDFNLGGIPILRGAHDDLALLGH